MSEKKIANPELITCEIQDLEGNTKKLEGVRITKKNSAAYMKMEEEARDLPIEDQLPFQMSWIYGGQPSDYENYDIRVLRAAVNYFGEQLRNPI